MTRVKNKICLICCRGGSKTIKNKNIKKFCNKPLLSWSLKNILDSKIFNRVILSTDSIQIAKVAKKYKIEIPGLRPKYLASSNSNQFDTHNYIFKKLNINDKNSVVCIYNNNPFVHSKIIKKSFDIFKNNKFKGLVIDATRVDGDYIAWKQFNIKDKKIKFIDKRKFLNLKLNRQFLNKFYTNIFNLRWGKPSLLSNYKKFKKQLLFGKNKIVLLKKIENFDLDDKEDWKIGEAVFSKILNEKKKFFQH